MKFIMNFLSNSLTQVQPFIVYSSARYIRQITLFTLLLAYAHSSMAVVPPPSAHNGQLELDDLATHNAVVLLYHHVSTTTPSSTSVSPAKFQQHMSYIQRHHTVLPLKKVIEAFANNTPLPSNTVAITFDDGYENIRQNAHPILRDMGFPYTIFINPAEIGNNGRQLTWEQVKAMQSEGVSFANHTLDHLHMLDGSDNKQNTAWLEQVWQNVKQAEALLAQKTGESLKYLAYPYGEFNRALAQKLKQEGYIAFGQHSGAIGPKSNFQALPRFPAAGPYARLETLKTKLSSLAMPVEGSTLDGLSPQVPDFSGARELAPITITVNHHDVQLSNAACYFAGNAINTTTSANTITFDVAQTLPIGRSRVNCTAPSKGQKGRYYWYSQPFFVANADGNFID